jgi:hypothetical protein
MAKEYTNLFHSNTLQNLPKVGFIGLKVYHLATVVSTRKYQKIGFSLKILKIGFSLLILQNRFQLKNL